MELSALPPSRGATSGVRGSLALDPRVLEEPTESEVEGTE